MLTRYGHKDTARSAFVHINAESGLRGVTHGCMHVNSLYGEQKRRNRLQSEPTESLSNSFLECQAANLTVYDER